MEKTAVWGIALILVLVISYGNAEDISPGTTDKAVVEKVENESLPEKIIEAAIDEIEQPSPTEEETEGVSQVAERRMSLYDFFFGNKNNNNNNDRNTEIQPPSYIPGQQQAQVQQNPNQLMFVREATFPNPNGGLLSRLILARRMSRLQRLSNRLQILPAMFGLFQRQQQQIAQQRTLNQRIGGLSEYNPADILLEPAGFKNASVSPHRQYASDVRFNQNFANEFPSSQNHGFGRFANGNLYGINEVPNQPYPQTQTSAEEFGRLNGNFGLRQNIQAFDQQGRQKDNIYNQQQQQAALNQQQQQQQQQQAVLNQQQQQAVLNQQQQQPLYNQEQLRQQQVTYGQNSQNQNQEQQSVTDPLQLHFDQQQQQLKYQQQLLEHQEQLRQQQQQLYDQQQKHLRQQQLYDQQQQQAKEQKGQYEKQQQQQQAQQIQGAADNYEQKASYQPYDEQQLKLQQELYEQQNQLKKLLLEQQQQLRLQDDRYKQLQKQLHQDEKGQAQQQIGNQQSRDRSYYNDVGNHALSGNSGGLDFGNPGTYDVGVEISADPFKAQVGSHTYSSGGTVDSNIGAVDKTSHEQKIPVGYKPSPVVSTGWKLPLFPIGLFPKPLFNINGKVFFGAELGKGGGVTTGGWK